MHKEAIKHACNYMHVSENDEKWGLFCTTAGMQDVPENSIYPIEVHPDEYNLKFSGRVLNEYQLVYIVSGKGIFKSASCPLTEVSEGMMIILFPGEWHYYAPLKETGWKEYWVGFRGPIADNIKKAGFFSPQKPILHIGYSAGIENCYNEIIRMAEEERHGFQLLISGIVMHILGSTYYKNSSLIYKEDRAVSIINQAKEIMIQNIDKDISINEVCDKLCVGYSWFRHKFKEHVGSSPMQYLLLLKFKRAKDLLSTQMSIKDVAYTLGFDNFSQFSNFFKRYAGESPRDYRNKTSPPVK